MAKLSPPGRADLDPDLEDGPDSGPSPAVPVVAVVGRPNVGKSTLVNRILGSRQAVVEDTPGVTRDRVAYDATWRGRSFTLVDTGGWEPAAERSKDLTARVAAQARVAVDAADAVLFVVDAVVGVTDADAAVAAVLRANSMSLGSWNSGWSLKWCRKTKCRRLNFSRNTSRSSSIMRPISAARAASGLSRTSDMSHLLTKFAPIITASDYESE